MTDSLGKILHVWKAKLRGTETAQSRLFSMIQTEESKGTLKGVLCLEGLVREAYSRESPAVCLRIGCIPASQAGEAAQTLPQVNSKPIADVCL